MIFKNQKCYFRTSSEMGYYKALLQITNRCNMKCKHCFVDSSSSGEDMSYDNFIYYILPLLIVKKTSKVTITGGEPTLNHDLIRIITKLVETNIEVALCTNGLFITKELLNSLSKLSPPNKVHINVSLDSYHENGYSNFRGIDNAFNNVMKNIEMIAKYGYLKGILCTPNSANTMDDYIKIVDFTKKIGGKYVLFNPIAKLGRGEDSSCEFGVSESLLKEIYYSTHNEISDDFDITYVRFPLDTLPKNSNCIANNLMYIYVNGDIVRCPYISFASNDKCYSVDTEHNNIIGNIYNDDFNIINDRLTSKSLNKFGCEELEL